MIKQQQHFQIQGMQQDLSVVQFPSKVAFELNNMRITIDKSNSLLALSKEKGTTPLALTNPRGNTVTIKGTIIGVQEINNQIVIFSTDTKATDTTKKDYIYLLSFSTVFNRNVLRTLYNGNLNFDDTYPIESIASYETNEVQKVYWVDGVNSNRCINIALNTISSNDNTQFDFIKSLGDLSETLDVYKQQSGGKFTPGVIQYCFTYYNKYDAETPIINITPLQYISSQQGIANDKTINCSFKIELNDLLVNDKYQHKFDYIRLYAIERSSIDSVVKTRLVTEVYIKSLDVRDPIIIIDDGIKGETIDSSLLFYLGGANLIASTLIAKDNTLFLGNLKSNVQNKLSEDDLKKIQNLLNNSLSWKENTTIPYYDYINYKGYLNYSSNEITTFKSKETYRIGIQFQYDTGLFSNVIYLKDFTNNINNRITLQNNTNKKVLALSYLNAALTPTITTQLKAIFNTSLNANIVRARLMFVYPKEENRSVICQGFISPCVYSPNYKLQNGVTAISSWLMRPLYENETMILDEIQSITKQATNHYTNLYKMDVYNNYYVEYEWELKTEQIAGQHAEEYTEEFKLSIKSATDINKIQASDKVIVSDVYTINWGQTQPSDKDLPSDFPVESFRTFLNKYIVSSTVVSNIISILNQYADSNLKKNENLAYQVRTKNTTLLLFTIRLNTAENNKNDSFFINNQYFTLNSPEVNNIPSNFFDNQINSYYLRLKGYCRCNNIYSDMLLNLKTPPRGTYGKTLNYVSNNNVLKWCFGLIDAIPKKESDTNTDDSDRLGSYYAFPIYLWNREIANSDKSNYQSGTTIRSSVTNIERKIFSTIRDLDFIRFAPEKNYSNGNYLDSFYRITLNDINVFHEENQDSSTFYTTNNYKYQANLDYILNSNKYPILGSKNTSLGTYNSSLDLIKYPEETSMYIETNDAIQIKYNSSSHLMLNINTPLIDMMNQMKDYEDQSETDTLYRNYEYIENNIFANESYYWIAELYKQNVNNLYPTINEAQDNYEALNQTWIPIGNLTALDEGESKINLIGDNGDTYYQRWDCLKTYPKTKEDTNQVIDITSGYIETRINIDGRTDVRNRVSILNADNTNFNLLNDIYNQTNNVFSYTNVDSSINEFPTQISYSNTKTIGEKIDTWMHINSTSIVNCDGTKGKINSLQKLNDQIFAFQDTGIAKINFNSRVQINTTDGVPIEISNSGKVDGVTYISDTHGTYDKNTIIKGANGIYFIDNKYKSFMLFNGQQIQDISESKGMKSWFNSIVTTSNVSSSLNNLITSSIKCNYDKLSKDVYIGYKGNIQNKNTYQTLAFNEQLNSFTSFYNLYYFNYLTNLNGQSICLGNKVFDDNTSYIHTLYNNTGNSTILGDNYNYSISCIANENFDEDKIFDTIEFNTNDIAQRKTFKQFSQYPFTSLNVSNEYQQGQTDNKTLIKKFRTWRWSVPRNNTNVANSTFRKDRIRNNWCKFTLTGNTPLDLKIYDISMTYYLLNSPITNLNKTK